MTNMVNNAGRIDARDPEQVKKEAIGWYVLLCSGDATEHDRQALQQWRAVHPDHQHAWARFETMRQSFAGVPVNIAAPTLAIASKDRRRAMRSAVWLLAAGTAGWSGYQLYRGGGMSPDVWLSDYRTRVGEQRRITLADGSLLILNTDTAVDIVFDGRQRLIRLHGGELLLESAAHRGAGAGHLDTRPLVVATRHGRARALGTRFTVRRFDDRTEVAVLDSAVDVTPEYGGGVHSVLHKGQRVAFSSHELFTVGAAGLQDDWSSGSLLVNNWRLADVIAELGRYRHGRMACDPAVAEIRVSGAFPLQDTDRALAVLVRSFPLRVSFLTRFWVRVGPV